MLKPLLLLPVFLFPFFLWSQDCTKPDTAQMRREKVKSVTVYFARKGQDRMQHHVYEYNRRGQLVREKEGAGASVPWTVYKYDEQNRVVETSRMTAEGRLLSRTTIDFPVNKAYREVTYSEEDYKGVFALKMIYRYDSLDRMIYQAWYHEGKMTHAQYLVPQGNGQPNDSRDSVIQTQEVYWMSRGHMVKLIRYDAQWQNPVITEYRYSETDGSLEAETITSGKQVTVYVPKYDDRGAVSDVFCNDRRLGETEKKEWINKHRGFPRPPSKYPYEDQEQLPYGLPVPDPVEKREPQYNAKGLLKEEKIVSSWLPGEEVKFVYEYTFY